MGENDTFRLNKPRCVVLLFKYINTLTSHPFQIICSGACMVAGSKKDTKGATVKNTLSQDHNSSEMASDKDKRHTRHLSPASAF